MSGAGKSLLTAGLCRLFYNDGYRVMPFKSQNMALNSFITKDGLEIGRAQAMQAEAAKTEPSVYMNPILLKPVTDTGSQVIVNGEVVGNMKAAEYYLYKKELIPYIIAAFKELEKKADIIVMEGAGSPAEINLRENDIVNMGMAELVDAPVLLAGDIDRGGVFAQLLGTVELLRPEERKRVKGFIINKFRGDVKLLETGLRMIEERCGIPVLGVVPYTDLRFDDEDSLSERFKKRKADALIDIAVIRFPHISNFTDLDVFENYDAVSVRYISSLDELGHPDMIILPGSKNTIGDLLWFRQSGLEAAVKHAAQKLPVFGICGGYQMLGMEISDPEGVEGNVKIIRGMELLNHSTELLSLKTRKQVNEKAAFPAGIFESLGEKDITGYEIHMGKSDGDALICSAGGNVYGSSVHGLFDEDGIAFDILSVLAERKGTVLPDTSLKNTGHNALKEKNYDSFAKILKESLDMERIYEILKNVRYADGRA